MMDAYELRWPLCTLQCFLESVEMSDLLIDSVGIKWGRHNRILNECKVMRFLLRVIQSQRVTIFYIFCTLRRTKAAMVSLFILTEKLRKTLVSCPSVSGNGPFIIQQTFNVKSNEY